MGNPIEYNPLPSGVDVPSYYTRIDAVTDAFGNQTNFISPNEGNVTITGITDAAPATGSTVEAVLFDYDVENGLPEEGQAAATSTTTSATDLNETDSNGKELYSWSVTLDTDGLAQGVYALQSFVYTQGVVTTNGVPTPIHVFEPDEGTVTIDEFVPFAYVVRQDTEVVTIGAAQTNDAINLPNATSTVQLSTNGRYAVWTSGSDQIEEDLQTGATIDLTAAGASGPALATDHSPTEKEVPNTDPYGPMGSGYGELTYPSFTEGGVTFGTIPSFDFNANDGGQNPLPTVTDSAGTTSVLAPFGVNKTMAGYAAAASDDGNAVLTVETSSVTYLGYGSSFGLSADPQYYVVYRSPAPTLTLNPINGSNQFAAHGTATLTGTSNAVGQTVEIDFGAAGAEIGTATVLANGTWSFSFNAAAITGTSLFIEASVSSAAGTPAEVNDTAQIVALTLPTLTGIDGTIDSRSTTFGPTETLTITLDTNEPVFVTGAPTLTLSNGEAATYNGGSGTDEITFTYVPGIHDASSADLAVIGLNLPSGAAIGDGAGDALGGPFTKSLGLILQTTPAISALSPASETSNFITNSSTPTITVGAEVGETITIYDDGTAVGSGTVPDFGIPSIDYIEIPVTAPLPEGTSTLTAAAVDASGRSSMVSDPVSITVDTVPPAERVLSLAVNGTDNVDLAHQASLSVTITGRLDAPLQSGESITVVFANGATQTVTPAAGVTGFSVTVGSFDAESFGVGGSVSAYVQDAAGNVGTATTQAFTADSLRTITLISANPVDSSQANEVEPALSGDGKTLAFAANPQSTEPDAVAVASDATPAITAGIYLETLSTGALTLAVAAGTAPVLSNDGSILAYVADATYPSQVYVKDLATGVSTLVSGPDGMAGDGEAYDASLSADGGKVTFLSTSDDLVTGVGNGPEQPAGLCRDLVRRRRHRHPGGHRRAIRWDARQWHERVRRGVAGWQRGRVRQRRLQPAGTRRCAHCQSGRLQRADLRQGAGRQCRQRAGSGPNRAGHRQ